MIGDAMRSTLVPQACITGGAYITHKVRITFRKERITQKSLFCTEDKRDFFVGDPDGIRTRVTAVKGRCLRPLDHRAGWWL